MSKQQYRVVADREKGDEVDHYEWDAQRGDRVVWEVVNDNAEAEIVRVERPVATTCTCPPLDTSQEPEPEENCPRHGRQSSARPPTSEQIAEAIEQDERVQTWHAIWAYVCEHRPQSIGDERTAEQYVLDLLNGSDR